MRSKGFVVAPDAQNVALLVPASVFEDSFKLGTSADSSTLARSNGLAWRRLRF